MTLFGFDFTFDWGILGYPSSSSRNNNANNNTNNNNNNNNPQLKLDLELKEEGKEGNEQFSNTDTYSYFLSSSPSPPPSPPINTNTPNILTKLPQCLLDLCLSFLTHTDMCSLSSTSSLYLHTLVTPDHWKRTFSLSFPPFIIPYTIHSSAEIKRVFQLTLEGELSYRVQVFHPLNDHATYTMACYDAKARYIGKGRVELSYPRHFKRHGEERDMSHLRRVPECLRGEKRESLTEKLDKVEISENLRNLRKRKNQRRNAQIFHNGRMRPVFRTPSHVPVAKPHQPYRDVMDVGRDPWEIYWDEELVPDMLEEGMGVEIQWKNTKLAQFGWWKGVYVGREEGEGDLLRIRFPHFVSESPFYEVLVPFGAQEETDDTYVSYNAIGGMRVLDEGESERWKEFMPARRLLR